MRNLYFRHLNVTQWNMVSAFVVFYRYNYSSEEKFALIEIIAMIKGLQVNKAAF